MTALQALGMLDPEGNLAARLGMMAQADVARLKAEHFDRERDQMIGVCIDCHSSNVAEEELAKGDRIILHTDHLLAEALRRVHKWVVAKPQ